jgi:hypothetical protein
MIWNLYVNETYFIACLQTSVPNRVLAHNNVVVFRESCSQAADLPPRYSWDGIHCKKSGINRIIFNYAVVTWGIKK